MSIIINTDGTYDQGACCKGKEHGSAEVYLNDGRHLQAMIGRSSFAPDCYFAQCYTGAAALCSFSINLDMPFREAAHFIAGIMVREACSTDEFFKLTHGHTSNQA